MRTPAIQQHASADAPNATTLTISLPTYSQQGTCLLLCASWIGASPPNFMPPPSGGIFQPLAPANVNGTIGSQVWYASSNPGGVVSITISVNHPMHLHIELYEIESFSSIDAFSFRAIPISTASSFSVTPVINDSNTRHDDLAIMFGITDWIRSGAYGGWSTPSGILVDTPNGSSLENGLAAHGPASDLPASFGTTYAPAVGAPTTYTLSSGSASVVLTMWLITLEGVPDPEILQYVTYAYTPAGTFTGESTVGSVTLPNPVTKGSMLIACIRAGEKIKLDLSSFPNRIPEYLPGVAIASGWIPIYGIYSTLGNNAYSLPPDTLFDHNDVTKYSMGYTFAVMVYADHPGGYYTPDFFVHDSDYHDAPRLDDGYSITIVEISNISALDGSFIVFSEMHDPGGSVPAKYVDDVVLYFDDVFPPSFSSDDHPTVQGLNGHQAAVFLRPIQTKPSIGQPYIVQRNGASGPFGTDPTLKLPMLTSPGTTLVYCLTSGSADGHWTMPSEWIPVDSLNEDSRSSIWVYPNNPGFLYQFSATWHGIGGFGTYEAAELLEVANLAVSNVVDRQAHAIQRLTNRQHIEEPLPDSGIGDFVIAVFEYNSNPSVTPTAGYIAFANPYANGTQVQYIEYDFFGDTSLKVIEIVLATPEDGWASMATLRPMLAGPIYDPHAPATLPVVAGKTSRLGVS